MVLAALGHVGTGETSAIPKLLIVGEEDTEL